MKYNVLKKDGSTTEVIAENWRQAIPDNQFYNVVIKGLRKVDDVVYSVPINEVVTIQLVDESDE